MHEERVEIHADGLKLSAVLCAPAVEEWPLVVLCHGLLSHKDSSKYRQLAKVFAQRGIGSIRFDFRGCGESEGVFEEGSVSGRWRDLLRVIEWAGTLEEFNDHLGLLGSSLGGYLALLEASRNPLVRSVVVWATPSNLVDLAKRLPEVVPFGLSRGFCENLGSIDLLSLLEGVRRVMILHGQQDKEVPPQHASNLLAAVAEPKCLHVFENGDHRFSETKDRDQAVRYSLEWFLRYL